MKNRKVHRGCITKGLATVVQLNLSLKENYGTSCKYPLYGYDVICVAPRDMPGYIDFFIAKFIIIVYCFISA